MVDITNVEITDDFWLPKIRTIQQTTIPFALDKCTVEGRLDNFLIAGKKKQGTVRGAMPFDDTDVYKIIEGASYSLISAPNKELDATLDSIIAIIKIGQEPDGYLTTWCTIDPFHPPAPWAQKTGKRWIGESSNHELYNSGHLFEAAAAHYHATGKRNFLELALKNADLLVQTFGPGKLSMPPGHQIVETGLIKLYRITGNEKYVQLAKYFLDVRGDSTTHSLYGEYSQDQKPVVQQNVIVGHAVRAVYMYAGMTDIAALYRDSAYLKAVTVIWTNMIEKKIYLTGGIGAKHEGEALGNDYELPNLTAYGETCASIGNVYWNNRLFMLSGDSKYFDVIERSLYNGLISGISLDGKNFFYVNPLEADGSFKFNSGACTRRPWFDCSCCPTNLIRFIPSLPGLIYAVQGDILYVNLYMSSKARVQLDQITVQCEQQSDYPWEGTVHMNIIPERAGHFTIKLRLPGWAQNQVLPGDLYSYADSIAGKAVITVNGRELSYAVDHGYAVLARTWMPGDSIRLTLPMSIRRVVANERVKDDENLTALEYGPLVYCFEGIDNNNELGSLTLSDHASLKMEQQNDLFHQKMNIISGELRKKGSDSVRKFTALPYYAWSNRGPGSMKVWMPRK
ncbi:MAG: glycoside hydrolase family 127 protein [Ignavibacteriae bacterium]|nr:MAG: glycoside hydrolase family 127 protein [Ignavibacteriota bacterium]